MGGTVTEFLRSRIPFPSSRRSSSASPTRNDGAAPAPQPKPAAPAVDPRSELLKELKAAQKQFSESQKYYKVAVAKHVELTEQQVQVTKRIAEEAASARRASDAAATASVAAGAGVAAAKSSAPEVLEAVKARRLDEEQRFHSTLTELDRRRLDADAKRGVSLADFARVMEGRVQLIRTTSTAAHTRWKGRVVTWIAALPEQREIAESAPPWFDIRHVADTATLFRTSYWHEVVNDPAKLAARKTRLRSAALKVAWAFALNVPTNRSATPRIPTTSILDDPDPDALLRRLWFAAGAIKWARDPSYSKTLATDLWLERTGSSVEDAVRARMAHFVSVRKDVLGGTAGVVQGPIEIYERGPDGRPKGRSHGTLSRFESNARALLIVEALSEGKLALERAAAYLKQALAPPRAY